MVRPLPAEWQNTPIVGDVVKWLNDVCQAIQTELGYYIAKVYDWLYEAFRYFWDYFIGPSITIVKNTVTEIFNNFITWVRQGFETVYSQYIHPFLLTLYNWVKQVGDMLWTNFIKPSLDALQSGIAYIEDTFLNKFLRPSIDFLVRQVTDQHSYLKGVLIPGLMNLSSNTWAWFGSLGAQIQSWANDVSKDLNIFKNDIIHAFDGAFGGFIDAFKDFFKPVLDWFSNIPKWVGEASSSFLNVLQGFMNMLGNVGTSILKGFSSVGQTILGLGAGLLNTFKSLISSIGTFFFENFLKPIATMFDESVSSVRKGIGQKEGPGVFMNALIPLFPLITVQLLMGLTTSLGEGIGDTKIEAATFGIRPGFLKVLKALDIRGLLNSITSGYVMGLSMAFFSGTVLEQVRRESLEAGRPIPPTPGEAAWMYRKKIISEDLYRKTIARAGIMREFEDAIVENIWNYPPYADMIKIFVREAYEAQYPEEFARKMEGYPSDFGVWMEYIGFKEEWAKRLWASHWVLPSADQVYEMLWRRLNSPYTGVRFSISDVERFLKEADIDPRWRSNLVSIAYKLPGRIVARWGYEWGIWNEERFVQFLEAEGIDPSWIPDVLKAEKANVFREHINAVKSAIVKKVKEGFISFDVAKSALSKLGYPEQAVSLIIQAAQEEYDLENKIALKSSYISAYLDNKITEEKLKELLSSLGMTPERIQKEVEVASYKKGIVEVERETIGLRLERLKFQENEQILRVQDAQSDYDYAVKRLEAEKALWNEKIEKLKYEIELETVEKKRVMKMMDLEKMERDMEKAMLIANNRITEASEKVSLESAKLDAIRFEIAALGRAMGSA